MDLIVAKRQYSRLAPMTTRGLLQQQPPRRRPLEHRPVGHELGSARFRLSHEQAKEQQGADFSERTRVGGQLQ
jgi:hypothetical protein